MIPVSKFFVDDELMNYSLEFAKNRSNLNDVSYTFFGENVIGTRKYTKGDLSFCSLQLLWPLDLHSKETTLYTND